MWRSTASSTRRSQTSAYDLPGRLPELGVDAGLGEAGHGVDLVDEDRAVGLDKEVAAGEAAAAGEPEHARRQLLDPGDGLGGDRRRRQQLHAALRVLRLEVVPVGVRDDFARQRGLGVLVAEHRALDLAALRRSLDDHPRVVASRELDRRVEVLGVVDLRDPHARTEPRGLDPERIGEQDGASRHSSPSTAWTKSTCGTSWCASSRLQLSLSMQTADARTSEPT